MSKYLVETFYTCSFKVSHYLNNLNEKEISNLQNRNDGAFEILDIKLDNRKTKNLDVNITDQVSDNKKVKNPIISKEKQSFLSDQINIQTNQTNIKDNLISDKSFFQNTSRFESLLNDTEIQCQWSAVDIVYYRSGRDRVSPRIQFPASIVSILFRRESIRIAIFSKK